MLINVLKILMIVIMVLLEIDEDALHDLKNYLLSHEYDIAIDFEDFGDLEEVFLEIIGRKASDDRDDKVIRELTAVMKR